VIEGTSGPGKQLRVERESLGVTVREVADTLNLSIVIVQALEADDYERLPGTVFARGYIRAYARLLDLDPVPLLELFPGKAGGEAHPLPHDPGLAEWIRRRPALVLSVLGVVVVGALVSLATALWPEQGIESLWRSTETPAITVPPADAASDWDWEAEQDRDGTSDEGDATALDEGGAADSTRVELPSESEPALDEPVAVPPGIDQDVVEGTAELGGDGMVRRLTETGDQRLRMDFAADSWVEIRNPGGRVLYSNLNKAGTVLELVGAGPFRILLGYAPGVTLDFEGEPVALAPHTRNNVATLVLGQ